MIREYSVGGALFVSLTNGLDGGRRAVSRGLERWIGTFFSQSIGVSGNRRHVVVMLCIIMPYATHMNVMRPMLK